MTAALNVAPSSSRLLSRSPHDFAGKSLSDTQLSILKLVARGHSNAEIARRRGVTEKAIEGTITRLASKLGLAKDSASNQRVHIARVYFRALGLNLGDDD